MSCLISVVLSQFNSNSQIERIKLINSHQSYYVYIYVFQKGFAYTVLCWSWRRGYFLNRVVGSALLFLWMRLLFLFHIRHTMFIFIHNISLCKSNCEMDMKSCFLFLLNQKILQKAWNLIFYACNKEKIISLEACLSAKNWKPLTLYTRKKV